MDKLTFKVFLKNILIKKINISDCHFERILNKLFAKCIKSNVSIFNTK